MIAILELEEQYRLQLYLMMQGVQILRIHDVNELFKQLKSLKK